MSRRGSVSLYPHKNQGEGKAVLNKTQKSPIKMENFCFSDGKLQRDQETWGSLKGSWGERQRAGAARISLGVLQLCGVTGLGFAWPNWRWLLPCFTQDPILGFPQEPLHLIPITCRAKSSGMGKALDDSDLKSPQKGGAAQHWSHSKASVPSLGEA